MILSFIFIVNISLKFIYPPPSECPKKYKYTGPAVVLKIDANLCASKMANGFITKATLQM